MPENNASASDTDRFVRMTVRIVDSYLHYNRITATDVPEAIRIVHGALEKLASGYTGAEVALKPAVPIKKSIADDHLICLEDGKKLTMLKRYLWSHYRMTTDEYRKKWDLPRDYPMVAPAYARLRSTFAKKSGLGRISDSRARWSQPKALR